MIDTIAKPITELQMTNNKELKAWLKLKETELVSTIAGDIEKHVAKLRSKGNAFYGYAVIPGEYTTQPDPATVQVAFTTKPILIPTTLTTTITVTVSTNGSTEKQKGSPRASQN